MFSIEPCGITGRKLAAVFVSQSQAIGPLNTFNSDLTLRAFCEAVSGLTTLFGFSDLIDPEVSPNAHDHATCRHT